MWDSLIRKGKSIFIRVTNMIEGWKYYNNAVIPSCAPHMIPNLAVVKNKEVFRSKQFQGRVLLARWTSDWDCERQTEWWYIIKDSPFDISKLKAKRRYEINKGIKNFDVRIVDASALKDDFYRVTIEAYSGWPEKYRPNVSKESIQELIVSWSKSIIFGGFDRESGELMAYAVLTDFGTYIEFSILRAVPNAEKLGINAAMVAGILEHFKEKLEHGIYINDGSRSIRHETAFQDYLEKYFEFRKAYCKLEIAYKGIVGMAVKCLYPFKDRITGDSSIGSKVLAILKMEEIRRSCL